MAASNTMLLSATFLLIRLTSSLDKRQAAELPVKITSVSLCRRRPSIEHDLGHLARIPPAASRQSRRLSCWMTAWMRVRPASTPEFDLVYRLFMLSREILSSVFLRSICCCCFARSDACAASRSDFEWEDGKEEKRRMGDTRGQEKEVE